jgi:SAM-dependent methyltransferase
MSAEIPVWIAEYQPQIPLPLLVETVNTIFHSFAASSYDRDHPEIHRQLPPLWAQMIAQLPANRSWNILDLGCGTGFEAETLLSRLDDQVIRLTAYDPSPAMIALCRRRLQRFSQVHYCARMDEMPGTAPYNLLVTNSLLHHLPEMAATLAAVLPLMDQDAIWLAGHEPSARFFRNHACQELLAAYRRHRRRTRWLDWKSYWSKLKRLVRGEPLLKTAQVAFDQGLFLKCPTPEAIDRLVDFRVSRSADEDGLADGNTMDLEHIRSQLQQDWDLRWSKTYAFLGPFPVANASSSWARKARELERQFPRDGANFCSVWSRRPETALT